MSLEILNLSVRYGAVTALSGVSLAVGSGEIVAVLGPSGSGKTTLLQVLAGIQNPSRGEVRLEGRTLARPGLSVAPERRGIGMVFQDFALWPHMTVVDTIRFPLETLRTPRREQFQRVSELLALVHLGSLGDRYPHELSGGQRQRVAIARALATRPALILLDEPMSSLDARLRETMRADLARILRQERATALYVTHDRLEAMAVADRVLLLRSGQLIQAGTPSELYEQPSDCFTAEFMGPANWFEAEVVNVNASPGAFLTGTVSIQGTTLLKARVPVGVGPGTRGAALIRPEHLHVVKACPKPETWQAHVTQATYLGAHWQLQAAIANGPSVTAYHPAAVTVGEEIGLRYESNTVWFIPI